MLSHPITRALDEGLATLSDELKEIATLDKHHAKEALARLSPTG